MVTRRIWKSLSPLGKGTLGGLFAGLIIDVLVIGGSALDYAITGTPQEGLGLLLLVASFPVGLLIWVEGPLGPIINCVFFGAVIGSLIWAAKGLVRMLGKKAQAANGA